MSDHDDTPTARWFIAYCNECEPPIPMPWAVADLRDAWVYAHRAVHADIETWQEDENHHRVDTPTADHDGHTINIGVPDRIGPAPADLLSSAHRIHNGVST